MSSTTATTAAPFSPGASSVSPVVAASPSSVKKRDTVKTSLSTTDIYFLGNPDTAIADVEMGKTAISCDNCTVAMSLARSSQRDNEIYVTQQNYKFDTVTAARMHNLFRPKNTY
jgi:hypothetical protein